MTKYKKPNARLLDRTLAVSMGGCVGGNTPGNCGSPGFGAGTCSSPGNSEGVGPQCSEPGSFAGGGCNIGNFAN